MPVILCASASGLVEIAQIFFEDRYCSVLDWGPPTLGASVGGVLAMKLTTAAKMQVRRIGL